MSRAGEEMILELAGLLGTDTVKTAAKKDDDKEDKKDKKEDKEDKKEDDDKKDKKEDDDKKDGKFEKEKKASIMAGVLQDLVKLATELDELGADEASSLVDDALKVIVETIKTEEE